MDGVSFHSVRVVWLCEFVAEKKGNKRERRKGEGNRGKVDKVH